MTSRDDYFAKAITLLEEIKYSSEFPDFQTDMNLAVLCDKIGNSQMAKELLVEMAAVSIVIGVISILWFAGAGKRLEKKIDSEYSASPGILK